MNSDQINYNEFGSNYESTAIVNTTNTANSVVTSSLGKLIKRVVS